MAEGGVLGLAVRAVRGAEALRLVRQYSVATAGTAGTALAVRVVAGAQGAILATAGMAGVHFQIQGCQPETAGAAGAEVATLFRQLVIPLMAAVASVCRGRALVGNQTMVAQVAGVPYLGQADLRILRLHRGSMVEGPVAQGLT